MSAAVFTDSEKTDIRRFMGYPPRGIDMNSMLFGVLVNDEGVLEYRMGLLTEEEGVQVRKYLMALKGLEEAILAAADNLEDDVLGPLRRNKTEITERTALYDAWRKRLCQFLQLKPGPGLRSGGVHWVV